MDMKMPIQRVNNGYCHDWQSYCFQETYANEASSETTNPETSEPVVMEQHMEATEQGINIYEYVEEQWFKIVLMILL